MDFKLQMGRLLAIFIYLYFFNVAFFCYVYYHGLFVSCLGWCGCWAFFLFCDKYLSELLYLNNLQLNNYFWKIWVALKRAYGGYETHSDWLATEEAAAVEAVLWW